jgi:hypothetical protein
LAIGSLLEGIRESEERFRLKMKIEDESESRLVKMDEGKKGEQPRKEE